MESWQGEEAARAAHCWFDVDRVPRDAATTAWKRRARWHQAQWRQQRGYPIGAQPHGGGAGATPVGSRLELAFARRSDAGFVSAAAAGAARARLAAPEPFQTLHEDRLRADLLSSMPLCFNLFGDLAADAGAARRAVDRWWPDAPGGEVRVRFEHSPGRRDASFLGNRSAFDAAFDIAADRGARAVVGVETKYHEHARAQRAPGAAALARCAEVTERSGVFRAGWRQALVGTDLQQIWLDHLLVLAMLQHRSGAWGWGRFVLVYPRDNPSFASAARRYEGLLVERSTFASVTIEALLAAGALGPATTRALVERYLPG